MALQGVTRPPLDAHGASVEATVGRVLGGHNSCARVGSNLLLGLKLNCAMGPSVATCAANVIEVSCSRSLVVVAHILCLEAGPTLLGVIVVIRQLLVRFL